MATIDELAIAYKNGDTSVYDELCDKVFKLIAKESEKVWYKLKNSVELECRCLKQIDRILSNHFDPAKDKFSSLLFYNMSKERSFFLEKRGRQTPVYIEALASVDDSGEAKPFELEDNESNFELAFEERDGLNEKIALLAQDDKRKLLILTEWSNGTSDTKISELLAQSLGGKTEAHRKFIQRFRKQCQGRLAGAL